MVRLYVSEHNFYADDNSDDVIIPELADFDVENEVGVLDEWYSYIEPIIADVHGDGQLLILINDEGGVGEEIIKVGEGQYKHSRMIDDDEFEYYMKSFKTL